MKSVKQLLVIVVLAALIQSTYLHAQSAIRGTPQGGSPMKYPAVTAPPDSFFEKVHERDREVARELYRKYIDVKGMPVVAAAEVADLALQRTYDIVTHMLVQRFVNNTTM